jgi:hypothetical protein
MMIWAFAELNRMAKAIRRKVRMKNQKAAVNRLQRYVQCKPLWPQMGILNV